MFDRQRDLSADPDRVIAWRIDRLREAGFQACLADALARDTRYDLHALLDLTDRGCPAELATRILAPFARARVALATSQGRSADPAAGARSAGTTARRYEARSLCVGMPFPWLDPARRRRFPERPRLGVPPLFLGPPPPDGCPQGPPPLLRPPPPVLLSQGMCYLSVIARRRPI